MAEIHVINGILHKTLKPRKIFEDKMAHCPENNLKLSFLLINGKNASQKECGTCQERRDLITKLIKQENPDVILYQELHRSTMHLGVGDLDMYKIISNKAETKENFNGIAVKKSFKCQELDLLGIDYFFQRRCPAGVLKENGKRFLLVSYHGHKTKLNEDKIAYLKLLIQHVLETEEKYKCDGVVIGGDFNLAAVNVPTSTKYRVYRPSYKSIDYFVSNLTMRQPREITLKIDKGGKTLEGMEFKRILDHFPVRGTIKIDSEQEPKLSNQQTSYHSTMKRYKQELVNKRVCRPEKSATETLAGLKRIRKHASGRETSACLQQSPQAHNLAQPKSSHPDKARDIKESFTATQDCVKHGHIVTPGDHDQVEWSSKYPPDDRDTCSRSATLDDHVDLSSKCPPDDDEKFRFSTSSNYPPNDDVNWEYSTSSNYPPDNHLSGTDFYENNPMKLSSTAQSDDYPKWSHTTTSGTNDQFVCHQDPTSVDHPKWNHPPATTEKLHTASHQTYTNWISEHRDRFQNDWFIDDLSGSTDTSSEYPNHAVPPRVLKGDSLHRRNSDYPPANDLSGTDFYDNDPMKLSSTAMSYPKWSHTTTPGEHSNYSPDVLEGDSSHVSNSNYSPDNNLSGNDFYGNNPMTASHQIYPNWSNEYQDKFQNDQFTDYLSDSIVTSSESPNHAVPSRVVEGDSFHMSNTFPTSTQISHMPAVTPPKGVKGGVLKTFLGRGKRW